MRALARAGGDALFARLLRPDGKLPRGAARWLPRDAEDRDPELAEASGGAGGGSSAQSVALAALAEEGLPFNPTPWLDESEGYKRHADALLAVGRRGPRARGRRPRG